MRSVQTDGSDEGQQKVQRPTAYFQNPAGSLPPQSNPFAEFQEAQMLEDCRRRSMGNMSIEQLQLQHLASSGPFLSRGLGVEGTSPPHSQGGLAASMPFDSTSFRCGFGVPRKGKLTTCHKKCRVACFALLRWPTSFQARSLSCMKLGVVANPWRGCAGHQSGRRS